MHIPAGRPPFLGGFLRILHPDVGRTANCPRVAVRHLTEVDFDAVAHRESIATPLVLPGCKAQTPVVLKGLDDIADSEDRCDPLQDAHGWQTLLVTVGQRLLPGPNGEMRGSGPAFRVPAPTASGTGNSSVVKAPSAPLVVRIVR